MDEFIKELCETRHRDIKEQMNLLFKADKDLRDDMEELKRNINGKFTKLFILLFTVLGMLSMNLVILLLRVYN